MTEMELSDTEKKAFFVECENLTLMDVFDIKGLALFFRTKRIFQNLRNRFLI